MVVEIKEYASAEEIAETLEKEISETKSTLGEYLRRLDDIRALAEKSKKIREVVMKLAGKKSCNRKPRRNHHRQLKHNFGCQPIPRINSHRRSCAKPSRKAFGSAESPRSPKMARPNWRH